MPAHEARALALLRPSHCHARANAAVAPDLLIGRTAVQGDSFRFPRVLSCIEASPSASAGGDC